MFNSTAIVFVRVVEPNKGPDTRYISIGTSGNPSDDSLKIMAVNAFRDAGTYPEMTEFTATTVHRFSSMSDYLKFWEKQLEEYFSSEEENDTITKEKAESFLLEKKLKAGDEVIFHLAGGRTKTGKLYKPLVYSTPSTRDYISGDTRPKGPDQILIINDEDGSESALAILLSEIVGLELPNRR